MNNKEYGPFLTAAFSLFIIFYISPALAGQYAVLLSEERVPVGSEVYFELVFLQDSPDERARFPVEIACQLTAEGGLTTSVQAGKRAIEADHNEPSVRTYFKQPYSFRLPGDMEGSIILKLNALEVPSLVFHAEHQQNREGIASDTPYRTLESLFTLYQPYAKNASAYEPMYFLAGTELSKSKFQISFKYRFIHPDTAFAEHFPWVSGLHFGYTQTSYWDLESDSAPFSDTSYKPELFWLSDNYLSSQAGLLKGLFFQGGMQHESNGRGGDMSRSTNYLYARPILVFYNDENNIGLQVAPKFWTYINNDDRTNPDLMDYRGYFEIEAKAGLADSLVLGSTLRWAEEGGSIQFDLSYPLDRFFRGALDIYFYAQYTNMLAEGLLDYNERSQALRLGLAIVR